MSLRFLAIFLCALLLPACTRDSLSSSGEERSAVPTQAQTLSAVNPVARYFTNAELQAETEEQKRSICAFLQDLRSLSGAALEQRRYPDYQGMPDQWEANWFIQRYFFPDIEQYQDDTMPPSLGGHFYRDVKAPEAQEVIADLFDQRCMGSHES